MVTTAHPLRLNLVKALCSLRNRAKIAKGAVSWNLCTTSPRVFEMGGACCKPADHDANVDDALGSTRVKHWKKPRWRSDQPLTEEKLREMREMFWDTEPHYGGDRVIWDALRAACEAPDLDTARIILDSAGVIVTTEDMTISYDERGRRYDLPKYVISTPTNLIKERHHQRGCDSGKQRSSSSSRGPAAPQVELPVSGQSQAAGPVAADG